MLRWNEAAAKYGFATPRAMLEKWYVELQMSANAIAKKLGVTAPVVLTRLRALSIEPRPRGGNQRASWKRK